MERHSRQREAVRSALRTADHPLTAEELHESAAGLHPGLGIATVYRHLKDLKTAGEICAVELPSQPPRYERADHGHHHHFLCTVCGRVFDMHGCVPRLQELLPDGFVLEHHDITLSGRCADCR